MPNNGETDLVKKSISKTKKKSSTIMLALAKKKKYGSNTKL